jgi:riboflavin synthase
MFTGIISDLGKIKKKTESELSIETDIQLIKKLSLGASIAVNGICLTVISLEKNSFAIDFMPETAKKTNIQYLKIDDEVNLELPATPETFLSGHIVQGHVDAVGKIISIRKEGNSFIFTISIPSALQKYIVEKGSVTINGISLTAISVTDKQITVGIIPHTMKETMLHNVHSGDYVNLEVDIMAKYIEKLSKHQ